MSKTIKHLGVALSLMATALVVAAPSAMARKKDAEAAAAAAPKYTPDVLKALGAPTKAGEQAEVEKEYAAKDYAAATARVRAADAVPNLTPDDKYQLGVLKVKIGQSTNNYALMKEGIVQAEASGKVAPDLHGQFVRILASLAVNANDYAGAQTYYEQMAAASPDDASVQTDLAKIYLKQKQIAKAGAALQKAASIAEAKGAKADEDVYALRLQIAYDNKIATELNPAALALVKNYPKPKNWDAAIYALRSGQKADDQLELDTYRLQRSVGAMTSEGQFLDYAQTAQLRGLPAEARRVLNEGVAAKKIDATKPNYLELARMVPAAKVAADRASLPASERQARTSPNGKLANATADGYLANGDYAKAAELYRLALAKGGVDAARANTRLGIALANSGDKAGATSAFKTIETGPRVTLAQYWLVWLDQRA